MLKRRNGKYSVLNWKSKKIKITVLNQLKLLKLWLYNKVPNLHS